MDPDIFSSAIPTSGVLRLKYIIMQQALCWHSATACYKTQLHGERVLYKSKTNKFKLRKN